MQSKCTSNNCTQHLMEKRLPWWDSNPRLCTCACFQGLTWVIVGEIVLSEAHEERIGELCDMGEREGEGEGEEGEESVLIMVTHHQVGSGLQVWER